MCMKDPRIARLMTIATGFGIEETEARTRVTTALQKSEEISRAGIELLQSGKLPEAFDADQEIEKMGKLLLPELKEEKPFLREGVGRLALHACAAKAGEDAPLFDNLSEIIRIWNNPDVQQKVIQLYLDEREVQLQ